MLGRLRSARSVEAGAAAALMLLAGAVRLVDLDAKSVWFDEAAGYFIAVRPLPELLGAVAGDVHPPLGYLVAHLWPWLGAGDFALRLPAALFGTAAVGLTFLLGRTLGGRNVGLLAALLVAVHPFQVYLSQEARMYGLLTLLAVASLLLLQRGLEREAKPASAGAAPGPSPGWLRRWGPFALVTGLALLTHYYAFFLLAAEGLYVSAWLAWRRRLAVGPVAALGAAVLLFLPWLPAFLGQLSGVRTGYWIEPPGDTVVWDTFRALTSYTPPDHGDGSNLLLRVGRWLALGLIGLSALAGAAGLLRRGPTGPGSLLPALAVAIPVFGAIAFSSLFVPIYVIRYVGFAVPAFAVTLALGVALLPGRALRVGAAALLVLPLVLSLPHLHSDPFYGRPDLRSAAAVVRAEHRPGDLIIHTSYDTEAPWSYYLGPGFDGIVLEHATPEDFAAAAAGHARVWYVRGHGLQFAEQRAEADAEARRLLARLRRLELREFPGVLLYLAEP